MAIHSLHSGLLPTSSFTIIGRKYTDDKRNIQEWVNIYNNKLNSGKPKKRIGQYDLNTDQLIQIFDSAADAARSLKLKDKSCLCRAARLEGKSHGYKWRYLINDATN